MTTPDFDDAAGYELVEPRGLVAIDRAEIDVQIATAKRYPRKVSECLAQASDMVTADKATAESAFYELPAFKGSREVVVGPSIRCAEIVASCWGNLEYGSRPLEVDRVEGVVRAQGYCIDREKNIRFSTVKSRSIKTRDGSIYSDNLIGKTMLAAQAIAERDAISKVVPRVYVNRLYQQAMKVAEGETPLNERVSAMMTQFAKFKVKPEQIFEYLEVGGVEDITGVQLRHLRGVFTAIKEGTATVADVFETKTDKPVEMPKPKAKPKTKPKAKSRASTSTRPPESTDVDRKALTDSIFDLAQQVNGPDADLVDSPFDQLCAKVAQATGQEVVSDPSSWPDSALQLLLIELRRAVAEQERAGQ